MVKEETSKHIRFKSSWLGLLNKFDLIKIELIQLDLFEVKLFQPTHIVCLYVRFN